MSGTLSGLFFPACALFFSLLLFIIYFSKKRIDIKENKFYSIMIVSVLLDSIFALILQIVANTGINDIEFFGILFNKLDFICLITFGTSMLSYVLFITYDKVDEKYEKTLKHIKFIYFIINLIVVISPVEFLTNGEYKSIKGMAADVTFLTTLVYILLSFFISIINIKKINKKHLPILLTPLFVGMLLCLYLINPYFVIISIILTFINYIMFFTIENPDIKMMEEIRKANELSEKYNNDKSKFIFNMTQQVRYPLNSIEQKIEQSLEMNNINDIKEMLESIKSDEKRISNIINGTLDVRSIDSKKIKIVETEYNLSNLLKEISIRSEKMAAQKNIEFRTSIDESIPMFLYGDSVRMKQLINSIISNSIKYTNEGFVELDVSTVKTYDICRLIISIKDSGIGLKTEEIDKLFNNSNNVEENDSSNLKLEIVKKMVNIIGGTITVQSEKNKGSEFTIVVDQKMVNKKTIYDGILKNYQNVVDKKKILFVSEDEKQREFYRKRLSDEYIVELSKNGQVCLEKIRNGEQFDLIIINEETTKLSVLDILNKLKSIPDFHTKTLVLCKSQDENDMYIKEGFDGVLKTDMSQKSIIKNINDTISK